MNSRGGVTDGDWDRGEYTVREFRADDRDDYLALYETVFGGAHGREWFAWKYVDNPYTNHVPIIVAERDGDVVGARSLFPLELTVSGEPHLALQPSDTMIHPDHRGRGLLPQMTTAAIERYTGSDVSLFFNFPNRVTLPHNLRHGWETVGTVPTYYRVHDLRAMANQQSDASWTSVAGLIANPVVSCYYRLVERLASPDSDLAVRRHESVPAATLSALHESGDRTGIRAHGDERFYDWRFDNPDWDYRTYVVTTDGEADVAAVVGTGTLSGVLATRLTDVVPAPRNAPEASVAALVHRIVADHAYSDLLAAPAVFRPSTLRRAGFRSGGRQPLSYVVDQTTHVVRTLTDSWIVEGLDVRNGDNWSLTFAERDTS